MSEQLMHVTVLMTNSFFLYEGGQLELTREYFYQVKPGLSAYANDPKEVGIYYINSLVH